LDIDHPSRFHETEHGPNSTREAQALFKKALALDANSRSRSRAMTAEGTPSKPFLLLSALWLPVAYLGTGEDEKAQASLAVYAKENPALSIASWNRYMSIRDPLAMKQRERIVDALRRFGVPEPDSCSPLDGMRQ
jgi:hypothetical protein